MYQLTSEQWILFSNLRDDFRSHIDAWIQALPGLLDAQRALVEKLHEDDYALENPIVYNRALDDVREDSRIRWILVADNPGKKEQLSINKRYLVGSSGKVAENFFKRELDTDFRREVIIINKTPVHTPKTLQLKALAREYPGVLPVLEESQSYMARMAIALHRLFGAPLWIMGLSELTPRGIFSRWHRDFSAALSPTDEIYAFNHFSMGSFSTALKKGRQPEESTREAVLRLGAQNRIRVFGA